MLLEFCLVTALLTYSPEDPNFIFPDNTEIKNILGFQGSFISDLFFQSIGLIAYLFPFTLLFSGINIFLTKDIFLIIENIFFSILYILFDHFFLLTFIQMHLPFILMAMVVLLVLT